LYTTGFALLGFHEAARATGKEKYRAAADRLCRFTLRIQAKNSICWKIVFLSHAGSTIFSIFNAGALMI
jgi:hypothetical protein